MRDVKSQTEPDKLSSNSTFGTFEMDIQEVSSGESKTALFIIHLPIMCFPLTKITTMSYLTHLFYRYLLTRLIFTIFKG